MSKEKVLQEDKSRLSLIQPDNNLIPEKSKNTKIKKEAEAFDHEFYSDATDRQVKDDIVSYLGEYRFEVSEFNYELDFNNDDLVDPASKESMLVKAGRAIKHRESLGLNISREIAEEEGFLSLRDQISLNPKGTVVWFSPPGDKEEGYGDYGFAYVGKKTDNKLEMTAIRLEKPRLSDFNSAANALWNKGKYSNAEDFLKSPQVLNIDSEEIKDFIHGHFEIKDNNRNEIFSKVIKDLNGVISEYVLVAKNGTETEKHTALHVVENLSLELRRMYERGTYKESGKIMDNFYIPNLSAAMMISRFTEAPVEVRGSCGVTAKQSNDIFRDIKTNANKLPSFNKRDFDFDQVGPCRICERDVPCGPCRICESCNDNIDAEGMDE